MVCRKICIFIEKNCTFYANNSKAEMEEQELCLRLLTHQLNIFLLSVIKKTKNCKKKAHISKKFIYTLYKEFTF